MSATVETTPKFTVKTDSFMLDDFEAASLDAAIAEAFNGEGLGKITGLESLERKFAKYVADGGWCWIEQDDIRVVEIGSC